MKTVLLFTGLSTPPVPAAQVNPPDSEANQSRPAAMPGTTATLIALNPHAAAYFRITSIRITRSRFKTVLWTSLGLTALFVFITSEALLLTDYPMYHAYRLQVIADRHLLIPHALCGIIALLAGPVQFSSRLRQRRLKIHRVLGRIYVVSVFIGALTGIALAAGRPGMPGTSIQAAAWIVCTGAALITARNRQIHQHRQWMVRSYAVTFTFVSSRVLNLWPPYWSHLGDTLAAVGIIAFTLASLLVAELGLHWRRELTTRRA